MDPDEDAVREPLSDLILLDEEEHVPRRRARFESLDAVYEAIDPLGSSDAKKG